MSVGGGHPPPGLKAVWPIAATELLVSAAIQISNEVKWDAADFIVFDGMLITASLTFEVTMALTERPRNRLAGGLTIPATFFVV